MANVSFTQSLTYPAAQAIAVQSLNIDTNPDGSLMIRFAAPLGQPYQYTVTITDATTQAVHVHEGIAGDSFPGNDYYGVLTGYNNGGDFTVQNYTEAGPGGVAVSNDFVWLFTQTDYGRDGLVTLYPDARGGGFVPPACYAEGSRILTTRGEVAVEALTEGDIAITDTGALQPIVWIGRRRIDPARMANPDDYSPIRIRAHAFGEGVPHRDLRLSPDHAVFCDGALIPARDLLNGVTILRDAAEPVTYYHVELPEHAILLAEGLPAESYLDTGNRGAFVNSGPVVSLSPELAARLWSANCCAPTASGAQFGAVRRRLIDGARAMGFVTTDDPALKLALDGIEIAPARQKDGIVFFDVPAGQWQDIRLRSRSDMPAWTRGTEDFRRLGVAVSGLELRGPHREMTISARSSILSGGFHRCEEEGAACWRWTDGEGHLPAALFAAFPQGCEIAVRLTGEMTYWLSGVEAERAGERLLRVG